MRARLRAGLLILTGLVLVSACGPLAHLSLFRHSPAAVSGSPGERRAAGEAAAVRQKIRQQLATDNFQAALALVLEGGLSEEEVGEEYGRALRGVLKQAEEYLEKDQPEKAGPLYRAALEGYPKTAAVAARVGTRPAGIAEGIETCADQLLERGLAAYRSGNLDQAIRTWKLIHVFAPQHQASRKALQTAEVQLANLKKVRAEK